VDFNNVPRSKHIAILADYATDAGEQAQLKRYATEDKKAFDEDQMSLDEVLPAHSITQHDECCRSVVEVLSKCCRSVVEVLSKCCRSVVKVLSKCCRSVVEVLSKCCRRDVEACLTQLASP
jgi:hypothetical protein